MSLEKALEENTAAVIKLTETIANMPAAKAAPAKKTPAAKATPAAKVETPAPAAEKTKGQGELATTAKAKLGRLLKEKGKEPVIAVLAEFGAKIIGGVDPDHYDAFIEKVDIALLADEATKEEDFLSDTPTVNPAQTMETVKALLVLITNSKKLGGDVARNILEDMSLKKMGDMRESQFADATAAAEKVLKDVGELPKKGVL